MSNFRDGSFDGRVVIAAADGTFVTRDGAVIGPDAPSGAAGGDLSGTFPNPTVAQVNGQAASGVVNAAAAGGGLVPTSNGLGGYTWAAPSSSGAQALVPTAVKTGAYTASAADFVPCDVSGAGFTVTLPTAPADKTRIGVKIVAQAATVNVLAVARGGTDVFNKTGGSTSLSLSGPFQSVLLQYQSSTGIWYVQSTDTPAMAWETVSTVAASGAAQTIPDPSVVGNATVSDVTLTAACTFTLPPNPATGQAASFSLWLRQDATGARVPTFTGAKWPNKAGAPTFSVAASAIDLVIGESIPGGGGWLLTTVLNVG